MISEPPAAQRSASPEDLARAIVKRPGMYLGSASYERALGFLHGLAGLASVRDAQRSADQVVTADEFRADDSELLARISAIRCDPTVDEREAILALEPLLAEALVALQELDEI